MKNKSFMPGLIGIVALGGILGLIFVADDLTGLGYLANPLEFIALGSLGYYFGWNKTVFTKFLGVK